MLIEQSACTGAYTDAAGLMTCFPGKLSGALKWLPHNQCQWQTGFCAHAYKLGGWGVLCRGHKVFAMLYMTAAAEVNMTHRSSEP